MCVCIYREREREKERERERERDTERAPGCVRSNLGSKLAGFVLNLNSL